MCETYREQLDRLCQAMVSNNCRSVVDDLEAGSSLARLQEFVDENRERRTRRLSDRLEFVAEAFDNLNRLIEVYVREKPLAAHDSGLLDADRMLLWMLDKRPLTAVQRDYVVCQRARLGVEELARCGRREHLAFQQMLQRSKSCSTTDAAELHVNPVRTHCTFTTATLLPANELPPTVVLFFPVGSDIVSAVLEPAELTTLQHLASQTPCPRSQLSTDCAPCSSRLNVTIDRLLELGLLAATCN